jgi:hypothetical protein
LSNAPEVVISTGAQRNGEIFEVDAKIEIERFLHYGRNDEKEKKLNQF